MMGACYLLAVQTPVVGLEDYVPVAGDEQAILLHQLDTVRVALVLVCADNLLQLLRLDLSRGLSNGVRRDIVTD